jgi:hypothetical protein
MRNLALADVKAADLRAMLAENETLFVEHKTAIGGKGAQVAKAVCSFANSLGGWVLIGVTNGAPNAGQPRGWQPLPATDLTDRVREALKANRVDPIPAFASTVRRVNRKPVGLVRVYESADSPHVMGTGEVYVRSVAEDANRQRIYVPGGVETQAVLVDLVERGRRGEERARELIEQRRTPVLLSALGYVFRQLHVGYEPVTGTIALRAAPITGGRLKDWAVSTKAKSAVQRALRRLAGLPASAQVESMVNVSGLAARFTGELTLAPRVKRHARITVAADCGGLVGASIWFPTAAVRPPAMNMTLDTLRDTVVTPLLNAVCDVLEEAELYGRSILHMRAFEVDGMIVIDDRRPGGPFPPDLPIGGDISLPLSTDRAELQQVANQWRADIGRATGYEELR